MFNMTKTFKNELGFSITPFSMDEVGYIFFPKEIEKQLDYENLSNMVNQSNSFTENVEYITLRKTKLSEMKNLLAQQKDASISKMIYQQLKFTSSLIVLTEAGLYTVMLLSRKKNAQMFRRWVTCEVLPSIRKTGMYKVPGHDSHDVSKLSSKIDLLQHTLLEQQQLTKSLFQMFHRQEKYQQYALKAFERIETVLSESLPHDMFEGWKKIKSIVKDMKKIYNLSEKEVKRYIQELCKVHNVQLPEKTFTKYESYAKNESSHYELKDIAIKLGIYSIQKKPHIRLLAALIRHLNLEKDEYRCIVSATLTKYSGKLIPLIAEWLLEKEYPKKISINCGGKTRNFQACYHFTT